MHRREFLKAGAAAIAAGAFPSRSPSRVQDEPKVADRLAGAKLKLSLAAYSFRQQLSGEDPPMDLADFVDLCAREGLEGTELTSYYFRDTTPRYLRELRRRAYVNGLSVSGTPVRNDFCLPPGAARQKEIDHVKTWLDHCVHLGSQTMRVFAGNPREGVSREQAREWTIEGLREIAAHAGERGVLLGIENHGYLTESAADLIRLVESTASPWLGVNLDTGNFREDPYGNMEKAAPYAVACQVKVALRGEDGKSVPCDFARVAKILRAAGYRGFVALEYESAEDPHTAVPRHLEELREAMGTA